MCGVPTISFDFGESVYEEIKEDTGIVIPKDDVELYTKKIKELMNDLEKLNRLSVGCKEFSNNFLPEKIVNDWIGIFKQIDKE